MLSSFKISLPKASTPISSSPNEPKPRLSPLRFEWNIVTEDYFLWNKTQHETISNAKWTEPSWHLLGGNEEISKDSEYG
jgi:hypothetical protein